MYARGAGADSVFRAALGEDFIVPQVWDDLNHPRRFWRWSSSTVSPLMRWPITPKTTRDRAMAQLVWLTLHELFELGQMQTDPNFANYRLAPDGRIVLLDFGATRDIASVDAQNYRALLRALLAQDRDANVKP